jgi:hypothetical protein
LLLQLYITDLCAHYGLYKFHQRVHNSSLHAPIPNQINTAHVLPTYFYMLHLNIIFAFTFNSSRWSSLPIYPLRLCMLPSFSPTRATRTAHLIFSVHIIQLIHKYDVIKICSFSLRGVPHFYVTPALLDSLNLPPVS